MAKPTFAQAREILKYDSETGKLFWKERAVHLFATDGTHSQEHIAARWNSRYANKEAFTAINNVGYHFGQIGHRPYLAHVVIWLIVTGDWPTLQIDHINGDKLDNRLVNLRHVSQAINQLNQKRSKRNKSGVMGVFFIGRINKWNAYINKDRKHHNLGYFHSFQDAVAARKSAETQMGFHPNQGRSS